MYSFYTGSGFDGLVHREGVIFNPEEQIYSELSLREVSGPMIRSLDLSLSRVLLPRIHAPKIDFEGEPLTVSFTADGSLASVDGGIAELGWWDGEVSGRWTVVFPPGTSFSAPPNPDLDLSYRYWPSPGDAVWVYTLRLQDLSYRPSYSQYRQRPLEVFTTPGSGSYTARMTAIFNED